jgi:hypothetical protein
MEKAIILIQRKFLLKKLLFEFKKNKNIFDELNYFISLHKNINLFGIDKDKKFNELKMMLIKKDNIAAIDKILFLLYRVYGEDKLIAPKIDSRKFMIGWMINSFPEFMLDIKDPENNMNKNQHVFEINAKTCAKKDIFLAYPYDIYLIINDFIFYVNLIINTNYNNEIMRKFKKNFNKYSNAINYFLKRDKNEQIQKLLIEFANINKTIKDIRKSKKYQDEEQRQECIETIAKTKSKIANHLKKLDSGIDIGDLEIQSQIHEAIENNMEKAICDILINDIKNKKFSYFSKFIDDVSNQMIQLGAKNIDSDFENKIDKDFIIQKMTYLNTEHKHIIEYGDYIVNIINNLQSPIDIETTKEEWDKLKNGTECKSELLGRLVIFILKEIKMIYETIDNLNTINEALCDIEK